MSREMLLVFDAGGLTGARARTLEGCPSRAILLIARTLRQPSLSNKELANTTAAGYCTSVSGLREKATYRSFVQERDTGCSQ